MKVLVPQWSLPAAENQGFLSGYLGAEEDVLGPMGQALSVQNKNDQQ